MCISLVIRHNIKSLKEIIMSKSGKSQKNNDVQAVPGQHWDGKKTTKGIVNDAPSNLNPFQMPKGSKK